MAGQLYQKENKTRQKQFKCFIFTAVLLFVTFFGGINKTNASNSYLKNVFFGTDSENHVIMQFDYDDQFFGTTTAYPYVYYFVAWLNSDSTPETTYNYQYTHGRINANNQDYDNCYSNNTDWWIGLYMYWFTNKPTYLTFDLTGSNSDYYDFWWNGGCNRSRSPSEMHFVAFNNYYQVGGQSRAESEGANNGSAWTLKDSNFSPTGGTATFHAKNIVENVTDNGFAGITRGSLTTLTSDDYITVAIYRHYGYHNSAGDPSEVVAIDTQHYYFTSEINNVTIEKPETDKQYSTGNVPYDIQARNDGGYTTFQLTYENLLTLETDFDYVDIPTGNFPQITGFKQLANGEYDLTACMTKTGKSDVCSNIKHFHVLAGAGGYGTYETPPPELVPFAFDYGDYSPFETPSGTFTYLTTAYANLLDPLNTWANYFALKFNFAELTAQTETIKDNIKLFRSYIGTLDEFFGGVPISLFLSLFILVIIGKTIFMLSYRIITIIKP